MMPSDAALRELLAQAPALGMNAEHVLRVLFLESTLDPSSHRAGSVFSGMNQSTDASRREAGIPADVSAAWTTLDDATQMRWIVESYIPYQIKATGGAPFATPGEYMGAQLAPANVHAPRSASTVVLSAPAQVRANAPLDVDGNGKITIGDLDAFLANLARRADYAPIAAKLASLQTTPPAPPAPPVPAPTPKARAQFWLLFLAVPLGLAIAGHR